MTPTLLNKLARAITPSLVFHGILCVYAVMLGTAAYQQSLDLKEYKRLAEAHRAYIAVLQQELCLPPCSECWKGK